MNEAITMGAAVAIIEEGQVLMTQREDFEVWCLPGGEAEANESLVQTATREAHEETGLVVEVTSFVGLHTRVDGNVTGYLAIFAARQIGGTLAPQVAEVLDIGYFSAGELPAAMLPWHRMPIDDALAGRTGVVYTTRVNRSLHFSSRQELYALRDRSGMSRLDFFRAHFELDGALDMRREL